MLNDERKMLALMKAILVHKNVLFYICQEMYKGDDKQGSQTMKSYISGDIGVVLDIF